MKKADGWLPVSHATARFQAFEQMDQHRRRTQKRRRRGLRGALWALLIRTRQ